MLSRPASAAEPLQDVLSALAATGYRFATVTPATHARVNARPGNAAARSVADVLGWSRPFDPDVLPPGLFDRLRAADAVHPDPALPPLWRSDIRVSTIDETLFAHSAFPTTARDAVFFGPDTYKFVDAVRACMDRREAPVRRAVDVCCGAGPAALAVAARHPDASVLMADINPRALRYAGANAACAGARRARPIHSDLLAGADGRFDLVVAHPPYLIDRDARTYRHGGGALGAELALDIVRAAIPRLERGGTLLLFTGIAIVDGANPLAAEVERLLRDAPVAWRCREVDPDVFGEELDAPPYDRADRIALVVIEATRAG